MIQEIQNNLNNNPGVVAVIGIILTTVLALLGWKIKESKKSINYKSPSVSAGRDIKARDIIVGDKHENTVTQSPSTSKINIELAKKEVGWAKYAVSRYVWPSFKIVLLINNYNSDKGDYVKPYLVANSTDGEWKTTNFIFQNTRNEHLSNPNKEYFIEKGQKETVTVFISSYGYLHREREPIPDFDKDTLKLKIETESGEKFSIPIKPGWIIHE